MARKWSLPALALVAALATAACGGGTGHGSDSGNDTGNNNEDRGMQGTTDATPGNTLDGGAGVTGTVSADTSTAKTATGPSAPRTDSARGMNAAAGGPVPPDSASGDRPGAGQPVTTTPQP